MKKIQVNHTPDFIKPIAITITFLWIISVIIISYLMSSGIAFFLSMVILFLILSIACYIDYKKTTVEYDTEKIHWKWLFFDYTVNLKDMEFVHYTIISERTRYGYTRHFEIVFKVKDSELRLNDHLKTEDIENCINGTPDNIKLMQLYKFIENIYPEKSSGFLRTNEIN